MGFENPKEKTKEVSKTCPVPGKKGPIKRRKNIACG
jgi:hypothetical protein